MCINYDRIFDASYLANEMISGEFQNMNMAELMMKIANMREGKLGNAFVKFAEPIDLNEFVEKNS